MRPTWAEVSLNALRQNFRAVQKHVGPSVTLCAVVKADAYGHGAVECARALLTAGATWLGVTSTEEGVLLRGAGITARILLMTGFWQGEQEEVIARRLTPVVSDWWQIGALESAAAAAGLAPKSIPVHIKVDTGMARLGIPLEYLERFVQRVQSASPLAIEGLMTHLASAERLDAADAPVQLKRFQQCERLLNAMGEPPAWVHCANSAAIAARRDTWKNMARPGIALYGYLLPLSGLPESASRQSLLPLRPVLSWKTRIVAMRDVPAGHAVGYGGAHVTAADARIAVLPVGYADGLSRRLSGRGRVIVRGRYAPVAGVISMDLTLVDVSDIAGASLGDEVTILGEEGDARIDAWEHARLADTIPYEVLCNISRRVPRRYADSLPSVRHPESA